LFGWFKRISIVAESIEEPNAKTEIPRRSASRILPTTGIATGRPITRMSTLKMRNKIFTITNPQLKKYQAKSER
jgi:hypothetical protein